MSASPSSRRRAAVRGVAGDQWGGGVHRGGQQRPADRIGRPGDRHRAVQGRAERHPGPLIPADRGGIGAVGVQRMLKGPHQVRGGRHVRGASPARPRRARSGRPPRPARLPRRSRSAAACRPVNPPFGQRGSGGRQQPAAQHPGGADQPGRLPGGDPGGLPQPGAGRQRTVQGEGAAGVDLPDRRQRDRLQPGTRPGAPRSPARPAGRGSARRQRRRPASRPAPPRAATMVSSAAIGGTAPDPAPDPVFEDMFEHYPPGWTQPDPRNRLWTTDSCPQPDTARPHPDRHPRSLGLPGKPVPSH